jgi:hydroxymethylpyrimidine/phosphomethylpyrimidine kinase
MDTNTKQVQSVLSIAGSDPSGGAGIQGDLKTFTAIGVYGCAVITCNTVQNTTGVKSFQPVATDIIRQQILSILQDMQVTHIKIGMIGTQKIVSTLVETLDGYSGEIIWDPVLHASSGLALAPVDEISFFKPIMEKVTILTPNLPELAFLTKKKITGKDEIIDAGLSLLENYGNIRGVIIKGSHQEKAEKTITDYFLCRSAEKASSLYPGVAIYSEVHPRVATQNSHGTGCTFASAFTAFHMLTANYPASFAQATAFMMRLLRASAPYKIGSGKGPLLHYLACRDS